MELQRPNPKIRTDNNNRTYCLAPYIFFWSNSLFLLEIPSRLFMQNLSLFRAANVKRLESKIPSKSLCKFVNMGFNLSKKYKFTWWGPVQCRVRWICRRWGRSSVWDCWKPQWCNHLHTSPLGAPKWTVSSINGRRYGDTDMTETFGGRSDVIIRTLHH